MPHIMDIILVIVSFNFQGRLVPGWFEQKELLEKEGITFKDDHHVDLKNIKWKIK